jgi:2,3-bisphosphoglycerate-dependent phosphoglycerate mutase
LETRVLLLRHAESSAPDTFHGAESDIGLGPRGRRQAALLARYLATLSPDALHSSPMRRALETARPIGVACGLAVEVVPLLHEQRMGPLSGTPKRAGWVRYETQIERWKSGALDHAMPGAESYLDLRARTEPVLRGLLTGVLGKTVVVVCHGLVLRVLLTSLLDELGPGAIDRVGIDTASVNDLRFDGQRFRAEVLNQRPFAAGAVEVEESKAASE